MTDKFYVYEHWRPDKNTCFYVGKGYAKRASERYRNRYHKNIVAKLARMGMSVDARIIADQLTEGAAFILEKKRIAFWRAAGVSLTNRTDGGEGVSGLVWTKEMRANKIAGLARPEVKARMRAARNEVAARPEMREKYSTGIKSAWAKPGNKFRASRASSEFKEKCKTIRKEAWAQPEYREKYLKALKDGSARPEVKARRSAAMKKLWGSVEGRAKRRSMWDDPELKAKLSASLKVAFAQPEWKEKQSARIKAAWANPETREKILAGRRT